MGPCNPVTSLVAIVLLVGASGCGDGGGGGGAATGGAPVGDAGSGAAADSADSSGREAGEGTTHGGGGTSGSTAQGSGGAGTATGGATTAGASTGGVSTGGATSSESSSGGASTGGAATGGTSGGSSAGSGLAVTGVRCFEPDTGDQQQCYGKLGGAWARVYPPCWPQLLIDGGGYTPIAGGPSETNCTDTRDDLAAWDDARCLAIVGGEGAFCLFRLGDWQFQVFADCDFYAGVEPADVTDPGTASCGTPSGTSGWDETRCFDFSGTAYCYGRSGQYWVGTLLGDCEIDAFGTDPDFTEIPAAQAACL